MNQQKANSKGRDRNGGALIYVVDDEPMLLELAVIVLEPIGYDVKTFRDPKAALEAFRKAETAPALLITDYAMHLMNGMELMTACRGINPSQKILMISGTVDEKIFQNAPCKPNRFLSKPYQAKQLIEAVRSLLAA
jgi:CheY-like chemotaxis protein